jgi:hypothetical protein
MTEMNGVLSILGGVVLGAGATAVISSAKSLIDRLRAERRAIARIKSDPDLRKKMSKWMFEELHSGNPDAKLIKNVQDMLAASLAGLPPKERERVLASIYQNSTRSQVDYINKITEEANLVSSKK